MKWFTNLKVKTKMIVSFLLIIAIMAVLAVIAVVQLDSVAGTYKYVIANPVEAEMKMSDFDYATLEIRRMCANMVMFAPSGDAARIDGYHETAKAAYDDGIAALNAYRDILRTGSETEELKTAVLGNIDEIEATFTTYMNDVCDPVAAEAREGRYDEAIGRVGAGVELGEKLTQQTSTLVGIAKSASDDYVVKAEQDAQRTLLILAAISFGAAIIAFAVALYIAALISRPLLPLSAFMKKAGTTGDLTLNQEDIDIIGQYTQIKDELGETISSAAAFVDYVTNVSRKLIAIAEGDLTQESTLLSEKDTIGLALQHMLEQLNTMFGEINSSASQVSVGSKQIAEGAQSLAQGSTEQAASIEELSSTVSEIYEITKLNVDMTEKAVELAGIIKSDAQEGSRHMDEMIDAVNKINEVSKSIGKIINTIDDIAFQTNILALNAAVEAARAGQHGKGFAVVAEEVRNLADKSAQAAKETSIMIEDSAGKAASGAKIAAETAESLSHIVSGLAESTELVAKIAKSSEEQSNSISHVNNGIEQVAQVVQQNSATAEQSAAASEQMSGQSDMLRELVSRFKLKESKHIYDLPA